MPHHLLTGPSVIMIAKPQLLEAGIRQFAEERSLADIPKLYADTPIGRIMEHSSAYDDEKEHDDGEMLVEFAGRQCYRSWRKGRETHDYLENILETKHGSVLAHAHYSFAIFGISRAMSHELVRHAAGVDISQESQRFVDASEVDFVVPPALLHVWDGDTTCDDAKRWHAARVAEVADYQITQERVAEQAEKMGLTPTLARKRANEAARYSLPNAAETAGVWTFNIRALRHIINLRGDYSADLEIRRFAAILAAIMVETCPSTFPDVVVTTGDFDVEAVTVKYEKP